MFKKFLKGLLIFILIIGVIYAVYIYLTRDDDFEEFDDDFDFDDEIEEKSFGEKVKDKAKKLCPFCN